MLDTAIQFVSLFGFAYITVSFIAYSFKWSNRYVDPIASAGDLIPPGEAIMADIERHVGPNPKNHIQPQDDMDLDLTPDQINAGESRIFAAAQDTASINWMKLNATPKLGGAGVIQLRKACQSLKVKRAPRLSKADCLEALKALCKLGRQSDVASAIATAMV